MATTGSRKMIAEAHEAVTRYMMAVLGDADATAARRDAFALALAKHLSASPPELKRPSAAAVAAAKPKKPKRGPKLGKKERAAAGAVTAGKGTAWEGLLEPVNGRVPEGIEEE